MKGQSAIEYLMTYGWMLLVVAIVGGAVFSVVQQEDIESVSGFTGGEVTVSDFGTNSNGELDLILQNTAPETVEVNSINISGSERYTEWYGEKDISVGDTGSITLANITDGGAGANNLDVTISYDTGALENLQVSGTISGSFEITASNSTIDESEETPENFQITIEDDNSPVTENEDFHVDYSIENTGDISGTQDIRLLIDGTEEDSRSISLDGGELDTGTLTWSTETGDSGSGITYEISSLNSSETGAVTVEEIEGPTAQIAVNTTSIAVGETVEFNASDSSRGDTDLSGYNWDLNDGNNGAGEIVTHSYSSSGNYTVQLEVQDSNGLVDTDTVEIEVLEKALPENTISHTFEGRYDSSSGVHGTKEITDYSPSGSALDVSINVQLTEYFDYAGDEDARHILGVHLLDENGNVVSSVSQTLYFDDGNGETHSGSSSTTWNLDESTDYSWEYFYGIDATGVNEPYGPAPDDVDIVGDIDFNVAGQ